MFPGCSSGGFFHDRDLTLYHGSPLPSSVHPTCSPQVMGMVKIPGAGLRMKPPFWSRSAPLGGGPFGGPGVPSTGCWQQWKATTGSFCWPLPDPRPRTAAAPGCPRLTLLPVSPLQIKIWNIPKQLLTRNLTTYRKELVGHSRRVGLVEWHPTAANILFSAGYDYKVSLRLLDRENHTLALVWKPL